jgi:hypothetical protein
LEHHIYPSLHQFTQRVTLRLVTKKIISPRVSSGPGNAAGGSLVAAAAAGDGLERGSSVLLLLLLLLLLGLLSPAAASSSCELLSVSAAAPACPAAAAAAAAAVSSISPSTPPMLLVVPDNDWLPLLLCHMLSCQHELLWESFEKELLLLRACELALQLLQLQQRQPLHQLQ